MPAIARYPVREALLAYVDIMKDKAKETYYADLELYALGLTKQKPKIPEILKHG